MEKVKTVSIYEYMNLLGYDVDWEGLKRDFDELRTMLEEDGELWDYPVEELDYCREEGINVVLVSYDDCLGTHQRLFEIY